MADPTEEHPTAMITYAQSDPSWTLHETESWRLTVLRFASLLCEMGVDADLDQFYAHSASVDWNRFGPQRLQEVDFVLIAVSPAYKARWEGRNDPSEGAGAVREANVLQGEFNKDQERFHVRVKVVILPGASEEDIPTELSNIQYFRVDEITETALTDLYRTLTGQPFTPKPRVGPLRRLPPLSLEPEHEIAISDAEHSTGCDARAEEVAELGVEIARINAALSRIPAEDLMSARLGNFSLPWLRTAHELDREHQSMLQRLAELEEHESTLPRARVRAADGGSPVALTRLVEEIVEACGWNASTDATLELCRRLGEARLDGRVVEGLMTGLTGREPDIGIQKCVMAELHRHRVLKRNPAGRGYVVDQFPAV
jgi:hypothetical protein